MKKIFILFVILFVISGCNKSDDKKILINFKNKVLESKSYKLNGVMEIVSNEEKYTYNIMVSYKKDDYYNVTLKNQISGHEQVLLKNKDGVYVITPELNKSFKFQSEWPNNSSQAYLLKSIVNDINNDVSSKVENNNDNIIITSKVNYPNNGNLLYQKTTINKKGKLLNNIIYDKENKEVIKVKFDDIDYNVTYNDDYFNLSSVIDEDCCDTDSSTNTTIDNIIYPLYIPSNTYLNSKDVLNDDNNSRVILTFSGSKPFMLVEEPVKITSKTNITPIYGEPILSKDGFVALTDNSLTWISNNIEYYLTGESLTNEELLNIADSLNYEITSTMNEK